VWFGEDLVAIELGALLTAATSVSALVKEAIPIANGIRSGFRANNEKAQEELKQRLAALETALKEAGKLARVAQEYANTLEDVIKVLAVSQRAERFVKENLADLRKRTSPTYQSGWRILDLLIDGINTTRDAPREAMLDRIAWFGEKDRAQLDLMFNQFTNSFERAAVAVSHRFADDLLVALGQMIAPILDAEAILRKTEDEVLTTLQSLGR